VLFLERSNAYSRRTFHWKFASRNTSSCHLVAYKGQVTLRVTQHWHIHCMSTYLSLKWEHQFVFPSWLLFDDTGRTAFFWNYEMFFEKADLRPVNTWYDEIAFNHNNNKRYYKLKHAIINQITFTNIRFNFN
jgi:hypothetical protein